ncbi:hypothetical protein [Kangiella spongicola]|jgi:hypothetical protein|uniref:Uncharacterized protein n=1 Tax=Kangiella spongicola TaxID=796379 RepID=A0A318DC01_9GAMM|nr:hypothetical protein [Kangiella spongicola]MBV35720.1 hypothetical protein [Rickettsiales bacterium]PXF63669.1 hypothetical protein DL796_00515 [Kangiella spongicola]
MHFSRVIGGIDKDLKLVFTHPIALQWEDESYNVIELPNNLPKCSKEQFNEWTYPTLTISDSKWANEYAAMTHSIDNFENHRVTHYAFISMNDILNVLSENEPTVSWIKETY